MNNIGSAIVNLPTSKMQSRGSANDAMSNGKDGAVFELPTKEGAKGEENDKLNSGSKSANVGADTDLKTANTERVSDPVTAFAKLRSSEDAFLKIADEKGPDTGKAANELSGKAVLGKKIADKDLDEKVLSLKPDDVEVDQADTINTISDDNVSVDVDGLNSEAPLQLNGDEAATLVDRPTEQTVKAAAFVSAPNGAKDAKTKVDDMRMQGEIISANSKLSFGEKDVRNAPIDVKAATKAVSAENIGARPIEVSTKNGNEPAKSIDARDTSISNLQKVAAEMRQSYGDGSSDKNNERSPNLSQLAADKNGVKMDGVDVLQMRSFPAMPNQSSNSAHIAQSILKSPELSSALATQSTDPIYNQSQPKTLTTLKIQLNPAELGVVNAVMKLSGDELQVQLRVSNIEAYRQLSDDSSSIVKALRGQGFGIEQVNVQLTPGDRNSQQQANQQNGQSFQGQSNSNEMAGSNNGERNNGSSNLNGRNDGNENSDNEALQVNQTSSPADGVYL